MKPDSGDHCSVRQTNIGEYWLSGDLIGITFRDLADDRVLSIKHHSHPRF